MITMKRLFGRGAATAAVQADIAEAHGCPAATLPHQALVNRHFVDLLLEHAEPLPFDTDRPVLSANWHQHFLNLLENTAARSGVTPYFPSVLPRLMRLLREPDCPAQAVTELVASDATLAGNVLRLANSPLLRSSQQALDSLQKATAQLGFQGMYSLVAAAVMEPVILRQNRQHPRLAQRLWRHALCTAQMLAASGDTGSEGRGTAYLAGLLHGIGTIVICNEIQRHHEQLDTSTQERDIYFALIEQYASDLTQRIAEDWALPDSVQQYLQPDTAHPASLRLQRMSLAIKAGMLIEHRRMQPETLDMVCGEAPGDMGRKVMQLLQRQ